MNKKYATIKDIAKSLDISIATVSRALRNAYDVSSETRKKVLEEAERLKYRPNLNATGLVNSRTNKIGVIIPSIVNYYFSTVITGIQDHAIENDYQVILFLTNDSFAWELKIVRELSLTSLDGLLICLSSQTDDFGHFEELIKTEIPLVFFDRYSNSLQASRVIQDDYQGACTATEYLINCGFRKIAHITGPDNLTLVRSRSQGFLDTLSKYGLAYSVKIHSGFSQENGSQDITNLFKSIEVPDAIFAVNDRKAVGAILRLTEMGIRVGKDVGVLGFTNDPISEIISPKLSSIAEPAYDIGKKSCELLLKHIRKPNLPVEEIKLPTHLVIRESTGR
ncbi:LacI family DNA-binding transcriptional regulator [Dyadobacter aurulentus]|uniref:LacI family DNA-binding transcriptional regulator n=1 Tax=Dyadobacter sp. UC 10 TaxID=2605428 RepID=UPI0011F3C7F7|nr:LacI family DNA-binding transcriptional regulator [Dyadobacter sp. UC 10]KAA0989972.1 LacI family transcriptional regulator [Dyadobacter sp. UC 10]